MKSNKVNVLVLCFGLNRAQNTIVVYSVLRNKPIEMFWLIIHILWAQNKRLCTVVDLPTKILTSLNAPLMFGRLHNQSLPLTMVNVKLKTQTYVNTVDYTAHQDGMNEISWKTRLFSLHVSIYKRLYSTYRKARGANRAGWASKTSLALNINTNRE